jgi:hypothetical protein
VEYKNRSRGREKKTTEALEHYRFLKIKGNLNFLSPHDLIEIAFSDRQLLFYLRGKNVGSISVRILLESCLISVGSR